MCEGGIEINCLVDRIGALVLKYEMENNVPLSFLCREFDHSCWIW